MSTDTPPTPTSMPTVRKYEEKRHDDGSPDSIELRVSGPSPVVFTFEGSGRDTITLESFYRPKNGRLFDHDAMRAMQFAVTKLRERYGFNVDLGPLSGLGMAESVSETFDDAVRDTVPEAGPVPRADSVSQSDLVEEAVTGVLSATVADPDLQPRALDADRTPAIRPLAEGETVGRVFPREIDADLEPAIRPSLDASNQAHLRRAYAATESIGDAADWFDADYSTVYNRLVNFGIHQRNGDTHDDAPEDGVWCRACGGGPFTMFSKHNERSHDGDAQPWTPPAWLARHPEQILSHAPTDVGCSLTELCDLVEQFETMTNVHRKLDIGEFQTTMALCGRLGLAEPGSRAFVARDVLDERLATLREVALDE